MSPEHLDNGEPRLFGPSGRVDHPPQAPACHLTVAEERIVERLRAIDASLGLVLCVLEMVADQYVAPPDEPRRDGPRRSP